jgi:hypothetical protein
MAIHGGSAAGSVNTVSVAYRQVPRRRQFAASEHDAAPNRFRGLAVYS